jgi:hypothetical protein
MKRILLAGALLLGAGAWAQEMAVYRLQFVVRETENGKSTDTRNYTMLVLPNNQNRLNAGTKVPVPTGPPGNSSVTYVDVGVNLRAKVEERGPLMMLSAEIDISNLGAERENSGRPAPRIQQLHATVDTAIPPGQVTPIASLDDPATPRHYEIQVTATKVK